MLPIQFFQFKIVLLCLKKCIRRKGFKHNTKFKFQSHCYRNKLLKMFIHYKIECFS